MVDNNFLQVKFVIKNMCDSLIFTYTYITLFYLELRLFVNTLKFTINYE